MPELFGDRVGINEAKEKKKQLRDRDAGAGAGEQFSHVISYR